MTISKQTAYSTMFNECNEQGYRLNVIGACKQGRHNYYFHMGAILQTPIPREADSSNMAAWIVCEEIYLLTVPVRVLCFLCNALLCNLPN